MFWFFSVLEELLNELITYAKMPRIIKWKLDFVSFMQMRWDVEYGCFVAGGQSGCVYKYKRK